MDVRKAIPMIGYKINVTNERNPNDPPIAVTIITIMNTKSGIRTLLNTTSRQLRKLNLLIIIIIDYYQIIGILKN